MNDHAADIRAHAMSRALLVEQATARVEEALAGFAGRQLGNSYEQDIVDKHSTPGLRRNQFSREAKRGHLAGLKVPPEDVEKILGKLYGDDGPPKG